MCCQKLHHMCGWIGMDSEWHDRCATKKSVTGTRNNRSEWIYRYTHDGINPSWYHDRCAAIFWCWCAWHNQFLITLESGIWIIFVASEYVWNFQFLNALTRRLVWTQHPRLSDPGVKDALYFAGQMSIFQWKQGLNPCCAMHSTVLSSNGQDCLSVDSCFAQITSYISDSRVFCNRALSLHRVLSEIKNPLHNML